MFTTVIGTPLSGTVLSGAWTRVIRDADGGRGDLGTWGPEPKKEPGTPGRPPQRSFTPRFSVYTLRHTMATLNYLDGMDLGLLSRRLGHSSYSFTFERSAWREGRAHEGDYREHAAALEERE